MKATIFFLGLLPIVASTIYLYLNEGISFLSAAMAVGVYCLSAIAVAMFFGICIAVWHFKITKDL